MMCADARCLCFANWLQLQRRVAASCLTEHLCQRILLLIPTSVEIPEHSRQALCAAHFLARSKNLRAGLVHCGGRLLLSRTRAFGAPRQSGGHQDTAVFLDRFALQRLDVLAQFLGATRAPTQ